jgi:outer membrane biosynthesis protein TonB
MVVILAGAALLVFRLSVPKKPEQIAQQRRSTSTIDSASISSSTVATTSDSGPQEISEKIVTRTPAPTPGGSAMENTPPVPRHEPDQRPRLKEPADIAAVESKPVTDHPEKADEVAPSASPAPAVTLKLSKKAEESTPPLAKDQEEPAGGWVTESRNKATAPGSGMKRESKGPQPKGGWEAYRNYLTTNRVMPAERNNNTDTASVLVSFTIDGQGRPTDIRIERALCPACDKEAVRLVKDGPGWHQGPGGHSRTRMEIPF